MKYSYVLVAMAILLLPRLGLAHHTTSSGGANQNRLNYSFVRNAKPTHRVYGFYDLSFVDNDLAEIHYFTLGGEWAVNDRFSVGGNIPVIIIDHSQVNDSYGFGDLGLAANYLFFENLGFFGVLSTNFTFPTGNSNNGTGSGEYTQSVSVILSYKILKWQIYANLGMQYYFSGNMEPVLQYTLGAITPSLLKDNLEFGLAITGSSYLNSNTFETGSTKLFIVPSLTYYPLSNQKLSFVLNGQISILDDLTLISPSTVSLTDYLVLTDKSYSLQFGVNLTF